MISNFFQLDWVAQTEDRSKKSFQFVLLQFHRIDKNKKRANIAAALPFSTFVWAKWARDSFFKLAEWKGAA